MEEIFKPSLKLLLLFAGVAIFSWALVTEGIQLVQAAVGGILIGLAISI